ncbi:hydrolase [Peribacillus asahii]|uniref:hydrolase n=1 Tax=Peribacillus asahii TaxID=228899 RepID=UPI003822C4B3
MAEQRKTYYIWIPNGQISQSSTDSPWNFKIEATDDEIMQLREYFDYNYMIGEENFYRAHVPLKEYHHDHENDEQDLTLQNIYQLIYELGDEEAKLHIESMGILQAKRTDDGLRY